jgi:hypothetical protein
MPSERGMIHPTPSTGHQARQARMTILREWPYRMLKSRNCCCRLERWAMYFARTGLVGRGVGMAMSLLG